MKKVIFLLPVLFVAMTATTQLKTTTVCPAFTVDILDGKVNGLEATSTNGQIKKLFPCFTATEEEDAAAKCGGSVFYADKDIYFYTGRDYVEIGEKFKGKLSIQLLGSARNSLFKTLGHPKIKDVNWDAFQTAYGILILYYNKSGRVNKIRFSTQSTESIRLCE